MIYLDNAATTRVSDAALAAMAPCFQAQYGNPSSIHRAGQAAAGVVEEARVHIARLLGARPGEIYFTSGGTEADNWAIRSAAAAGAKKGRRHIIASAFEHHAVLHTLEALEGQGFRVTLLPVHGDGRVRPDELWAALGEDTALVTILYANNEIGTLQPMSQLGELCRRRGVSLHTDAVQAVGHVPVDAAAQNLDMLSLSAHKFHGPKGVGALYCRAGIPLSIFLEGGAQERGLRGGTENVPAIAGMAAALEEACGRMEEDARRVSAMGEALAEALSRIPRSHRNGGGPDSLPGIINFSFAGVEGEALVQMLDQAGICASSGSACTSGSLDPSHVLLALGLSPDAARGSLRFSLSRYNTMAEVEAVGEVLPAMVRRLRELSV